MKIDKTSAAVGAVTAVAALAIGLPRIADAASSSPSPSPNAPSSPGDRGRHFGAEAELTGSTADKVRAAVLAKLPGATIERMSAENSREGTGAAYEAHVTKADGTRVEVLLDKSFTVTAVDPDRRGGRFHDRGGAPDGSSTPGGNNASSGGGGNGPSDAVFHPA